MDPLGAGAMGALVVRGPEPAELLTASRRFPDEIGQHAVIGVRAGLGAQMGDQV